MRMCASDNRIALAHAPKSDTRINPHTIIETKSKIYKCRHHHPPKHVQITPPQILNYPKINRNHFQWTFFRRNRPRVQISAPKTPNKCTFTFVLRSVIGSTSFISVTKLAVVCGVSVLHKKNTNKPYLVPPIMINSYTHSLTHTRTPRPFSHIPSAHRHNKKHTEWETLWPAIHPPNPFRPDDGLWRPNDTNDTLRNPGWSLTNVNIYAFFLRVYPLACSSTGAGVQTSKRR